MAYHEVAMWEILEVLERLRRREGKSAVSRATGFSRSTIRRYLRLAGELGWTPEGLVEPQGGLQAVAAEIARMLKPVGVHAESEVYRSLVAKREQIQQWLAPGKEERVALRLTKVQQLLARQGIMVPYSTLHRFATTHCGFGRRGRITVRMAVVAPGELAEIDFGRLGLIYDPITERRRTAWALLVLLAHSRHQYVHMSFQQTVQAVINGLEDAWAFFGGVPHRVGLDNLAAAISKADRYDPIFQRTMSEYARYRGFTIDPAPVRMPTGKPVVERGVPYLRDSLFSGESWRGLDHLQEAAIKWCLEVAGLRQHGTTRERPLAVFENAERAALLPLIGQRFDPPDWAHCKVHPDHHISVGKALYSVPTQFIGKRVWVRSDSKLVRVYADHELVKTHPRQTAGGRSTDHADYPAELTPYTLRDPERIIRQAEAHGVHIGKFTSELLSGTFPWAKLRQSQRLLRLGEKYGWRRVDDACKRALAFELINVKRVESILRLDLQLHESSATPDEARVLQLPRFARDAASFSHHSPATTEEPGATHG